VTNERQQRAARAEQMRKEREKADRRQRNLITAAIVVIVLALVAIGGYAVKSTSDANSPENDLVPPKGATSNHGVNFRPEDAGGKTTADTVKVVIYEDFGCPGCRAFEQANGQFVEAAVKKGEITVEYRMVNFLDRVSPNKYSSRSGSAGLCAYDAGGGAAFKKIANLFWANQPQEGSAGPEDSAISDMLKQAGIDGSAVETCVVKERFVPWLNESTKASRKAKVTGTPTVRIDGKTVTGAKTNTIPQIADLQKAIDAAKKS
jgi:protein-disulfide isomerase